MSKIGLFLALFGCFAPFSHIPCWLAWLCKRNFGACGRSRYYLLLEATKLARKVGLQVQVPFESSKTISKTSGFVFSPNSSLQPNRHGKYLFWKNARLFPNQDSSTFIYYDCQSKIGNFLGCILSCKDFCQSSRGLCPCVSDNAPWNPTFSVASSIWNIEREFSYYHIFFFAAF